MTTPGEERRLTKIPPCCFVVLREKPNEASYRQAEDKRYLQGDVTYQIWAQEMK
jgi:hypothetical protein